MKWHKTDELGVYAETKDDIDTIIESRRKGNEVALFTFNSGFEITLPERWKDSELLWDNRIVKRQEK